MNLFRLTYFGIFLFVCITGLKSQDTLLRRSYFVSGNFIQIKEAANYGLVFRGPAIDFGFRWDVPAKNHTLIYENHLGVGIPFSKEIAGINFSFKPIDLSYTWDIPVGFCKLQAGPALKMQYDIQFYPDLQSGYDYWLTNFTTGIKVAASVPSENGTFRVSLYNSVAGFISRTKPYTDPYFFDLSFGEVLKDIHSNLNFSGPKHFNNLSLELNYLFKRKPRISISYILDYSEYTNNSKLRLLNQSMRFIIKAKK